MLHTTTTTNFTVRTINKHEMIRDAYLRACLFAYEKMYYILRPEDNKLKQTLDQK